ncbi:MAG: tRNA pseudouridine(38-40) synthase TruA [Acidimicrobiales bacterium]
MVVAYDGSGFRGFAYQPGKRTVAGCLAEAIATVARHGVSIVCAGRTDAGVHAQGQVIHVDVEHEVDVGSLMRSLNRMLAPEIVVREVAPAQWGFDARRSARWRHYRYLVLQAPVDDPLMAHLAWRVGDTLSLRAMAGAADVLIGEHDFSAFCRRPQGAPPGAPILRRVMDARWAEERLDSGLASSTSRHGVAPGERLLRFDIVAQAFCHQMVRSIVGTLVDVGRGKRPLGDVAWMLRSGSRSLVRTIAPPHGLCLVEVGY